MSINEKLAALAGKWKGTNRLFLSPDDDSVKESASSAAATTKANGQFLAIEYTWSFERDPQEGLLVWAAMRNRMPHSLCGQTRGT